MLRAELQTRRSAGDEGTLGQEERQGQAGQVGVWAVVLLFVVYVPLWFGQECVHQFKLQMR